MGDNSMSPADYKAITDGNNGMFGGDGAWWIIILFLFAFAGGWGNNGGFVGRGDGLRRDDGRGNRSTIVVALNPQQAATLVAAQRSMDLYPALRRPNDHGSLKRRDVGMVNAQTFENLRKGLEPVALPDGTKK